MRLYQAGDALMLAIIAVAWYLLCFHVFPRMDEQQL